MPSDTVSLRAPDQTADSFRALPAIFEQERIAPEQLAALRPYYAQLFADVLALRERRGKLPIVVGICGAQASGKSVLARVLQEALRSAAQLAVAVLSLDDLYLASHERMRLSAQIHPLLRTRGVPGTHDVGLGMRVIEQLRHAAAGEITRLPRFDKLADEPSAATEWEAFSGRADVILFEGWCVGALPQLSAMLASPVNALERELDAEGRWRGYVNEQLAGPYRELFGLLDRLVMLRAPGFDVVFRWRREQEHKLAARAASGASAATSASAADTVAGPSPRAMRGMSDAQLERFIMHFERLSRHILEEMPGRADVVVTLDAQRRVLSLERR
jgi:D-glycerate 3-kinase